MYFYQIRKLEEENNFISKVDDKFNHSFDDSITIGASINFKNKCKRFCTNDPNFNLKDKLTINKNNNEILAPSILKQDDLKINCKKFKNKFYKKNQNYDFNEISKFIKNFKGAKIFLSFFNFKKTYENSLGSKLISSNCFAHLRVSVSNKIGKKVEYVETCSFFDFSKSEELILKLYDKCKKKVNELKKAKSVIKGKNTILLDNDMAGLLAHEAFGHACEADLILNNGSNLKGKLGKIVANEKINIYDDPTSQDFGHYFFDDFGFFPKKKQLIKNGKLNGYISDLPSSKKLKIQNTGHARAISPYNLPIVRMSNTYIEKGDMKKDELIQDTKNGIYIKGDGGGSVDTKNGNFFFMGKIAYEIKNGEIVNTFSQAGISGEILSTLKNVLAISKDFKTSPGFCGKSFQSAFVSSGGPHIKIKDVLII